MLLLQAFYATIFAYGLAHLFGSLGPVISGVSLVLGLFFGWRHGRRLLALHPDWRLTAFHAGEGGVMEIVLTVVVLYASFRHFAWLLFPMDAHWVTLSATNFGDLPLHINYIRAFANGIAFPPQDPIFIAESLRYPFGPDLYNALWETLGVRLQAHLLLVGFAASIVSLILLRSFAGWWGIGAFFLSGGLAGWEVISGAPIKDFQNAVDWKNLFLAMFITQRGMLFALPVGLILLISYRRFRAGEIALDAKAQRTLGILWGFLPLFHLHAFVIVSLLLASIAVEYAEPVKGARGFAFSVLRSVRSLLTSPMALVAYVPAILFIIHSAGGAFGARSTQGIVRWSWGWLAKSDHLLEFLLTNFGPWLFVPLLLAGSLLFSKDIFDQPKRRRLWIELGFYCFWFVLFFNLMLAPWEWDNIKLLLWPYLGFARLLWVILEPRMGSAVGFLERPIVAMTLFLSGFIAVSWTLQAPTGRAVPIYSVADLAFAEGALSAVPPRAVFAAVQTHNHALTFFGRLRAVGYGGHLWSHGIDSKSEQDRLERIMKGDPDSVNLARGLGITHIYWGPEERTQFGETPPSWASRMKNVSRVPGYEIYQVQ